MAYHIDPYTNEPAFCSDRTGTCGVATPHDHYGSISEAVAYRLTNLSPWSIPVRS